MSRQAIPVLALTVVAAAALTEHRFVTPAGGVPAAGAMAFGVTQTDATSGDAVAATVLGTAILEAGGAVSQYALLQADSLGRGVTASTGVVLAIALDAATQAGDLMEVLMISAASHIADPSKLAQVVASNDITRYSADGAVAISGVALLDGGTGLAGLTLAAPQPGCQCRVKLDTLTSGTVVLTTAAGVTFDGANNTATFNAVADELLLGYKSATEWEVIANTSVTFSAV